MYLRHFGLTREPFHITPDPRFFYLSPSHKEAFAALIYGIRNRKGFLAVIGEVGLGKTTVLRTFLQQRGPQQHIKTVFIFNPNVTFKGLLHIMYDELGLEMPGSNPPRTMNADKEGHDQADELFELVHTLHMAIMQDYTAGSTVVLVIDEAQNMPVQTLEQLRMLSNLETATDKLLQIVLIGQPELEKTLNRPELRQLKQRIAIRSILRPLSKAQSRQYIQHRLHKAGAEDRRLFTRAALNTICRKANGTPRRINILCDNALITAFGYGKAKVTAPIVREVDADLAGRRFHPRRRWLGALALLLLVAAGGVWYVAPPLPPAVHHFWQQGRESLLALSGDTQASSAVATGPKAPPITTPNTGQAPLRPPSSIPRTIKEFRVAPNGTATANHIPSLEVGEAGKNTTVGLLPTPVATPSRKTLLHNSTRSDPAPKNGTVPAQSGELPPLDADGERLATTLDSNLPFYHRLSPVRQRVLIEMAHQTSLQGFASFQNMLQALRKEDFTEAARQMRFSHWHLRVGRPASELAAVMASGEEKELRQWLLRHGRDATREKP
ncbi:MAG: AAA family ATPase [Thermodesulfobacteriota bacterium]